MTNGYEKTLTENGRRFFVRCFSREIEKGSGGGLSTEKEHLALYRIGGRTTIHDLKKVK